MCFLLEDVEILKCASSECSEKKFQNNGTLRRGKLRKDWTKPVSYLQKEEELQVKNIARRFLPVVRGGYQLGQSEGKFTSNHSFIQRYLPMLALLSRGDEWWNRKQNGVGGRPSHFSPTLPERSSWTTYKWTFLLYSFCFPFQTMRCSDGNFFFAFFISYANICTCMRWQWFPWVKRTFARA